MKQTVIFRINLAVLIYTAGNWASTHACAIAFDSILAEAESANVGRWARIRPPAAPTQSNDFATAPKYEHD